MVHDIDSVSAEKAGSLELLLKRIATSTTQLRTRAAMIPAVTTAPSSSRIATKTTTAAASQTYYQEDYVIRSNRYITCNELMPS